MERQADKVLRTMEEIMLSAKCLWLLPITVLSFPVCAQALALNPQPESQANILMINKAADRDQKVNPKEDNKIIAIILQDQKTRQTRQTGQIGPGQTKPKAKKPIKLKEPGDVPLNPQPEPPGVR